MRNIAIIATLGPSTLKKNVITKLKKDISMFRLNMSHLSLEKLEKNLNFLKKNNINNVCIDTEGAQIRTTSTKKKYFKLNTKIELSFEKSKKYNTIKLYPNFSFTKINKKTKISIGFNNLNLIVISKSKNKIYCKVIEPGYLESNKGVHINANLNLRPLTDKDIQAIKISKKYGIKNYALSFANSASDVNEIKKLVTNDSKIISKIETRKGFLNRKKISSKSDAILIDRGDLSRYIDIPKIPLAQRLIINDAKKIKKKVFVATNLLENMILYNLPTRAESNDIFSTLEMGSNGLVLAAETAIGKFPLKCVDFLKESIKVFKSKKLYKIKNEKFF